MNYKTTILLFLTLNYTLYGEGSIDEQITKIMQSPQKERVELMNQFKIKLANLNAQERKEAIRKLQIGVNGNTPTYNGQNTPMHQIRSGAQTQHSMSGMNSSHMRRGR